MYVSFNLEKEEYKIDIFKNYKYINGIETKDFPQAIDKQKRVYSIDNPEAPKVNRYIIKIL